MKESRKKLTLLSLFFLFLVFLVILRADLVYSQSITPPIKEVDKEKLQETLQEAIQESNCGYATIKGKDDCCSKKDIEKKNKELLKEIMPVGEIPGFGIGKTTDLLVGLGMSIIPGGDKFCIVGEPVKKKIVRRFARDIEECKCRLNLTPTPLSSKKICEKIKDEGIKEKCDKCADKGGFFSGIGCVPVNNLDKFVIFLINLGIKVSSLLLFACLIYHGIKIQVSSGDEKKVQESQQTIKQCISGLILVLFSVFIIYIIQKFNIVPFM